MNALTSCLLERDIEGSNFTKTLKQASLDIKFSLVQK